MIPGKSACLRCALPIAGIDQVPLKPTASSTIDSRHRISRCLAIAGSNKVSR